LVHVVWMYKDDTHSAQIEIYFTCPTTQQINTDSCDSHAPSDVSSRQWQLAEPMQLWCQ